RRRARFPAGPESRLQEDDHRASRALPGPVQGACRSVRAPRLLRVRPWRLQPHRDLAGPLEEIVLAPPIRRVPWPPATRGTRPAATPPKIAAGARVKGTPAENKAVAEGSIAHYGRYVVEDGGKTLTMHIETSTFPNWDGTTQKRPMKVSGDTLSYIVPTPST